MTNHPTLSARAEEMRLRLEAIYPRAACQGVDTNMFFPPVGRGLNAATMMKLCGPALKVCASCDVRVECLEFAREFHQLGIWGGRYFGDRKEGKINMEDIS